MRLSDHCIWSLSFSFEGFDEKWNTGAHVCAWVHGCVCVLRNGCMQWKFHSVFHHSTFDVRLGFVVSVCVCMCVCVCEDTRAEAPPMRSTCACVLQ